jgi:hypothetical protein
MFLPQAQLTWTAGEALIQRFDLPGAKRFSVWFCPRCGSRVPHKARDRDAYLVPAGLLDGDPGARPENSIFWASRAAWYVDPCEAPKLDEYS